MDWLICCPVWGERCTKAFVEVTMPCLRAAIKEGVSGRVRFIVHTHNSEALTNALAGFDTLFFPVPPTVLSEHHSAGEANKQAIKIAKPGEVVAFVNADMACSIELFKSSEARFAEGFKMIMMAASRTIGGQPQPGMKSRDLLQWTMKHRHPAIKECFWGAGRTTMPWAIYFQDRKNNIVLHGFHLHPFAVLNDRDLSFKGFSIDSDLADIFEQREIHLITDPDEGAFAEMSPPERVFGKRLNLIDVESIAAWARKKNRTNAMHRWFFTKPITITGDGRDVGNGAIAQQILARIDVNP